MLTRTRKLLLAVAAVLAAATAVAAPAASAAPATSMEPASTSADAPAGHALSPHAAQVGSSIVNLNSSKCLLDRNSGAGTVATQFQCVASYNDQRWWLDYIGTNSTGDYWHIRNALSNLCLVVRGSDNGARAVSTECDTPDHRYIDQNFYHLYVDGPAGTGYALVNYNSGMCLASQGPNDDSPVFQTPCLQPDGSIQVYRDAIWRFNS